MTGDFETLRAAIVAEARRWIGTPRIHQASLRGIGCDCVGLVKGVGLAVGVLDLSRLSVADRRRASAYAKVPDGRTLREFCELLGVKLRGDEWGPGDVAMLHGGTWPTHLGIVDDSAPVPRLIHAHMGTGRVIDDTRIAGRVLADQVAGFYRYGGLARAPRSVAMAAE